MDRICCQAQHGERLSRKQVGEALDRYVRALPGDLRRVLLLPPDGTRRHSGAGWLTQALYHRLAAQAAVWIMPATGTHQPMTGPALASMFGDVPLDRFIAHRWREDAVPLGVVPADFMREISSGVLTDPLEVTVNRRLLSGEFDLVVSLGQVVPHEVVGMANYSKNILVGIGGEAMINQSHFIGAVYGLERLMGRDHSPVRRLYDYAEATLLAPLPIHYVLTVNTTAVDPGTGMTDLVGLFIGRERAVFEAAAALSRQHNITRLPQPVPTFVVYLDEAKFRTTWVGCKAIYRTRMAVADAGKVVVVAPGLARLGEDEGFDRLIRRYGYVGTPKILQHVREQEELRANLAVPAHLIHGSTEGRFTVTFATDAMTRQEIEGVNFGHMSVAEASRRYGDFRSAEGWRRAPSGEEVYYISNPATGLWAARERFDG